MLARQAQYLYSDTDGDLTPNCKDGCMPDVSKVTSGMCGCGIPNSNMDGDRTPNCKDGCMHDVSKMSSGMWMWCSQYQHGWRKDTQFVKMAVHVMLARQAMVSVDVVPPDTNTDGDGTHNCCSECNYNDPYILSICKANDVTIDFNRVWFDGLKWHWLLPQLHCW